MKNHRLILNYFLTERTSLRHYMFFSMILPIFARLLLMRLLILSITIFFQSFMGWYDSPGGSAGFYFTNLMVFSSYYCSNYELKLFLTLSGSIFDFPS